MLNYKLFGCHKIIKNAILQDYYTNIGLYLGLIIIGFNISCLFIFYFYFLFQIRTELFKLIPNKKKLYNNYKETLKLIQSSNFSLKAESKVINNSINKKNSYNKKNSFSKKNSIDKKDNKISINIKLKNKNNKNQNKKKSKFSTEAEKFNNSSKISKFINPTQKANNLNKKTKIDIDKNFESKIIVNDKNVEPNEYNKVPYSQALRIDKRNIFIVFISLIKMKIEIITIILYPEEFTNRPLLLSIYLLDFLFNYFMNALLYSDDVVSQKYHNNGSLDFITSITLSVFSNIISSIIIWLIKKLTNYHEFLQSIIKEIKSEKYFLFLFKRVYTSLKFKIITYFIISFLISIGITYYLFIFCIIYKKSQISLFSNFVLGEVESFAKSFAITLIVCILRVVSLKLKIKQLYRTSVYLDDVL